MSLHRSPASTFGRRRFRRALQVELLEGRRVFAIDESCVVIQEGSIVVNTTSDAAITSCEEVTLREAIEESNISTGPQTILFQIPIEDSGYDPTLGTWTIQPLLPLPEITDHVDIVGTSQAPSENPLVPYTIVLNGHQAGQSNGLHLGIGSDSSSIFGLVINGFTQSGILVESSSNFISGNYIGTDATGAIAIPNRNGVEILAEQPELLMGANSVINNLLSGNGGIVTSVDAQSQPWQYNGELNSAFPIGLNDGQAPAVVRLAELGLQSGDTVQVRGARGLTATEASSVPDIGPDGQDGDPTNDSLGIDNSVFPSFYMPDDWPLRLNGLVGAFTDSDGQIVGQPFGVSGGSRDLIIPVGATQLQFGLNDDRYSDNSGSLQVAVTRAGTDFIADGNGVLIHGIPFGGFTLSNTVEQNLIGTNASGTAALANTGDGVALSGSTGFNTIGTSNPEAIGRNVIAGNYANGVESEFGQDNTILDNWIGINLVGENEIPIPNGINGVLLNNGSVNNQVFDNVISGNGGSGVVIAGVDSQFNAVYGNVIGLGLTGSVAVPNSAGVALIEGTQNNVIGPIEAGGLGNVISGNTFGGVEMFFGSESNFIIGNLIGTDVTGTLPVGNDVGIRLNGFTSNTSGNVIANNVVAGNGFGMILFGSFVTQNLITTNAIGTNFEGAVGLGNLNDGIQILEGANQNNIDSNTIVANGGNGILIDSSTQADEDGINNQILGNLIGVFSNSEGATVAAGNGLNGILSRNSSNNLIGGDEGDENYISANELNGLMIENTTPLADGNSIVRNFIGTGLQGNESLLGNGNHGIQILNAGKQVVSDNTISANAADGIYVEGPPSSENEIVRNKIGTDSLGTTAIGNQGNGVNLIAVGNDNQVTNNQVSGNGNNGIYVQDSQNATILNNQIGTDATGGSPLGNLESGIYLLNSSFIQILSNTVAGNSQVGIRVVDTPVSENSHNTLAGNRVGGAGLGNGDHGIEISDSDNNLVSENWVAGNGDEGIFIHGNGAFLNTVQNNTVGLNTAGDAALPNGGNGIAIVEAGSENAVVDNLVSGNQQSGILVRQTQNVSVRGNTVGLNASGDAIVGNQRHGIELDSVSAVSVANNTTSGNGANGLLVHGESTGVTIRSNRIGTGPLGNSDLGNGEHGVQLQGNVVDTIIGGLLSGEETTAGNIISGNGGSGILLDGQSNVALSMSTTIQANSIGVDRDGNPLGNAGDGIRIVRGSSENTIGGDSANLANRIAFNRKGVVVGQSVADLAIQNVILGNSIFGNALTGIDLADDLATANDLLDGDGGPNGLQNTPQLLAAVSGPAGTTIYGKIHSLPSTVVRVEFFDNPAGGGQGKLFLGTYPVPTDAGGNGQFVFTFPGVFVGPANRLTATATLEQSGTSEFSAALQANEDVTARTSVTRTGFTYNRSQATYNQTLTIRNTSSSDLVGPLYIVLENLTPSNGFRGANGAAAANTGTTAGGAVYIKLPLPASNKLAAGASVSVSLKFSSNLVNYSVKLVAGPGPV